MASTMQLRCSLRLARRRGRAPDDTYKLGADHTSNDTDSPATYPDTASSVDDDMEGSVQHPGYRINCLITTSSSGIRTTYYPTL